MDKKPLPRQKIRLILIDSSDDFRRALRAALSESAVIEMTGEVSCADEALNKLSGRSIIADAAVMELAAENIGPACEFPVPCIFTRKADEDISGSPFYADTVRKPRSSSGMGTFCSLLTAKIMLAVSQMNGTGTNPNSPVSCADTKNKKTDPLFPSPEDTAGLDEKARNGCVVAMGASTGGTDALECVIKTFPETMPPILVVQHMPPVFTKLYSERLDKCCAVSVKEAHDGDRLAQGLCLVAAGGFHMELKKDNKGYFVKCTGGEKVSGHCPSADILFSSVAEAAGSKAAGVIMTGMGADGAKGLLKMKKAGAYTIGQDKNSCVVYGMPMEACKLGACSEQQPLERIGKTLCRRITDGWNGMNV